MGWLKWLAVVAMFAVGLGAVFVSTVGLGDTRADATGFLTQVARRTDVAQASAANGTVTSEATYALGFGEDARLAVGSGAAAASDATWMVDDVLVAVGDRVTAGQVLATASTADLERDLAAATASLGLAQLAESEARRSLDDVRADTRRQLVDAKTAVETARLALTNAKVTRSEAADGNPTRQAKIGVIQANDRLRQAKRTRDDLQEQLKGDFPDQAIALGEAQQQVADLDAQVADLNEAIGLARIVSPADGVVSAVGIEPGFIAPASDAIVIESATLEVVADVVESDISSLALGQTAMVSIDALDIDVPGTVTSIAPSTDGDTSSVVTFPVTVTLIDPDPAVRPGMSSDVEITIAEAPAVVAVPAVALDGSQGAYSVRVLGPDGGVQTRPVAVGLVTELWAEVQSGVTEGETVIVGTDAARVVSDEAEAGPGGPGGIGGGFRGLQGGGGGRPRSGGGGGG